MFKTIIKLVLLAALGVAVAVAVIALWVYVMLKFAVILGLFGIMWLCNARFTATSGGKKVGYYTRKGGFQRRFY